MKKLIPILILLAAGGGGAYYYYTSSQKVEPPSVTRATVSTGNITEVVQATGTLSAIRLVNVGSQVSGTVKQVFADYNSIVKANQLIATIDPNLLQVQVDLQNANVERQKGEIAIQEVQLQDAIKQQERTKQLFDKQLANQQQLDAADLTVKQRQTSLDAARKQLLTAEANLNQAKLNVSYTNIYAPIDGVVVERRVDPGTTVQASMTTPQFFSIATDLRELKLSAGVDESEIGKVRRDMRVTFTVESYPNTNFEGTVEAVRLNATNTNNVVTYPVWINVPNPDLRLKPSMTATVRIIVQTVANAVRIPNQALRFRPTNDMYTALGLTPPAAGQGRALGAGPNAGGRDGGAAGPAGAAAPGAGPAAAPAAGQTQGPRRDGAAAGEAALNAGQPAGQGQGRQGGGQGRGGEGGQFQGRNGGQQGGGQFAGGEGRGGGRGGRGGFDFQNMTPEQRQQMMAARGGGAGGRGGGRGGPGAPGTGANLNVTPVDLSEGDKIDDMFAPFQTRPTNGQVWTWDEANKKLTEIRVVTGVTDGQFSQLVTGNVKAGDQIVTSIIIPITAAQRAAQQSIFGQQQQGRGFGGPQQGFGGAGAFGGGGPAGGGGGGGRGGGGGGGGRGGGF